MKKSILLLSSLLLTLLFLGCAQNPVTHRKEFHFISQQQEIDIGAQHYPFAQQMNGGLYQIDPPLSAYVKKIGHQLANVSDRKNLPFDFVILNDSTPNAWALPGGKIAINRGLLVHLKSEAELAAVLAHEITHVTARHSAKMIEKQITLATGIVLVKGIMEYSHQSPLAQKLALGTTAVAVELVTQKYNREAEREADHYGITYMVKAGYNPQAAVRLQETFVQLMKNEQKNWLRGLFASHPPSPERVKANQQQVQNISVEKLKTGTATYQEKIAKLVQRQPAFDAFDEGKKQLNKKNLDSAMLHAEKAIQLEPREALFYALKADVLAAKKENRQAIKAYDRAIALDNNYYYYYLKRGLCFMHLNQHTHARSDLEKSEKLFPTESARNALKQLGNG